MSMELFNDGWHWLFHDPTGQRIALGLMIVLGLIAIVAARRAMAAMTKKSKNLPLLAALSAGGFYAAVLALQLNPIQWTAAAAIAFVLFLLLVMRQGNQQSGKGKRKAAH